jgi:hypothetical protein
MPYTSLILSKAVILPACKQNLYIVNVDKHYMYLLIINY